MKSNMGSPLILRPPVIICLCNILMARAVATTVLKVGMIEVIVLNQGFRMIHIQIRLLGRSQKLAL